MSDNPALTTATPVSAATLEHVLGTGDLSKLTTPQRVEYYRRTCETLGVNPLTRPFRFLALNGQIQLYATKDCTDQLRKIHGITLHLTDKKIDGELFIVTAAARDKTGREDEDMGAVTLGQLKGDSRANALMKCVTKAKRRVTLSICGLGALDESELDTLPGAVTFDAEAEPPAAPPKQASAPDIAKLAAAAQTIMNGGEPLASHEKHLGAKFLAWERDLRIDLAQAQSRLGIDAVGERSDVKRVLAAAGEGPVQSERAVRVIDAFTAAYARVDSPGLELNEGTGDDPITDADRLFA